MQRRSERGQRVAQAIYRTLVLPSGTHKCPEISAEDGGGLGGLGWADEGGFYGNGEADEFGDGGSVEVGDPEVSAGVDGDGVGSVEFGVGGPACGGGEGLAGDGGVGRDYVSYRGDGS